MLFSKFTAYADQMHDRKDAGALVVILRCRDRVGEQPSNMRMPSKPGRHARSNKAIDVTCLEHARERAPFRRIFEPDIPWERNGDLFRPSRLLQPASDPMNVRWFHAVIVFENRTRPDIGRELIFRHADLLTFQIGWLLDAIGPHIDGRVSKRA